MADGCMFPVRCWGCGKVQSLQPYLDKLNQGLSPAEACDQLKLRRGCCRRQYMTYNVKLERILTSYDASVKNGNGKIPNDWIGT